MENADSMQHEALRLFGAEALRDRKQLHQAYRQLAFRHHPDRNGASPASFARFKRITRLYQQIDACMQSADGFAIQSCTRCGERPAQRPGLDRNLYCRECLVYNGSRRLLPAPPTIVVRCGFSVAALAWACWSLGMMLHTQRPLWGGHALLAALIGLAVLAYTAVSIGVVHQRTARRRTRRWRAPLMRTTIRT